MKEKILTVLKSKYSDLGLGDAVLDSFATMLAGRITDEKDIEQQVAELSDVLKVLQSSSDKNRTENQKLKAENAKLKTQLEGASKKEEEKNDEQPGEQNPDKKDNSKDDGMPEWAKRLESKMDSFKEKIEERVNSLQGNFEHEKETNLLEKRTQEVNAIIDSLPEGLRKPYSRLNLQKMSDEDYEALKKEIAEDVESASKELSVKGASFKPPMRGNDGVTQMSKEKADAIAKRLVNR